MKKYENEKFSEQEDGNKQQGMRVSSLLKIMQVFFS